MRRLIILGIIVALSLTACGKPTQAETISPTTVIETTAEAMTVIETTEVVTKATTEIRQLSEQDIQMMNRLRQDVVDGITRGEEIDEEVYTWCNFLKVDEQSEFISELHLLEKTDKEIVVEQTKSAPVETKTAPKETKVSKPVETKSQPVPQETQAPTQPADQSNTGGYNVVGGGTVTDGAPLNMDPTYSQEELDQINNIQFN